MSATIIQMHQTMAARAQGAFAAVNIAARRLGYSERLAFDAARKAKQRVLAGNGSAAKAVSLASAELRASADRVQA